MAAAFRRGARLTVFCPVLRAALVPMRERVQSYPEVILVEGLFDYAAVWQAGFSKRHLLGTGAHLNGDQFQQLLRQPTHRLSDL